VIEGRVRKTVHLSAGVREKKLIAGSDLKLVAVEFSAALVVESIVAAEELRMDVDGNWSGPVDPLVPAETCGSVEYLLRFLSVHDGIIGDGNAAPHGDDVEMSTEKNIFCINNLILVNLTAREKETRNANVHIRLPLLLIFKPS
jgi:hypothetical protein